jgi:integrase
MGYVITRVIRSGKVRHTAVYCDVTGRRRSAGTFSTGKLAAKAWQKAEADLTLGRIGDPQRGRQTLRRYVEEEWFPNHVIEATTRESYTYLLNRYILPDLGGMRMVEILPGHTREWITRLQSVHGARPPTIRKCKVILDAILTTALNDQITVLHAGKGVKTPPVATTPRRIITVEQFDRIHAALADDTMRLLVETDIESGLRWGELTELRVKDLDFEPGLLTVARVVVHLRAKSDQEGPRFVVKDYPKDKKWRQVRLAGHLVAKLLRHVEHHGLGKEDLLFALPQALSARRSTGKEELPDPQTLGLTEPNRKGRCYHHGTTTAYSVGECRCEHCRNAISAYRAARRAAGKDQPRSPRVVSTDGHIGNDWFRANVWRKALTAADLGFHVTPHGLRHAHASWLLAGGADIQVVRERLGHGSIVTTEKYLHALPDAQDAALDALAVIRRPAPGAGTSRTSATEPELDFADMMAMIGKLKEKYDALQAAVGRPTTS